MKIAVIGTGYVGLVSGTCFAETGNTVTCVDIDAKRLKSCNPGNLLSMNPVLKNISTQPERRPPVLYHLTQRSGWTALK